MKQPFLTSVLALGLALAGSPAIAQTASGDAGTLPSGAGVGRGPINPDREIGAGGGFNATGDAATNVETDTLPGPSGGTTSDLAAPPGVATGRDLTEPLDLPTLPDLEAGERGSLGTGGVVGEDGIGTSGGGEPLTGAEDPTGTAGVGDPDPTGRLGNLDAGDGGPAIGGGAAGTGSTLGGGTAGGGTSGGGLGN